MKVNIENNTGSKMREKQKTKTKSNNNLSSNIKKFRKEMGLTQEELANRVGVSRQSINAIENGRMSPTLILAFRITYALNKEHIEEVFIYTD
mgnify:CR=1 FL=1